MIISIEGCIGSGKTTLLKMLDKNKFKVYIEDINKNDFELYLKNIDDEYHVKKFQYNIINKKIKFVNENDGENDILIFDRYIDGDLCFVDNFIQKGIVKNFKVPKYKKPDLVIYLKTKRSYQRLLKRSKNKEGYSVEYLERIKKIHDNKFKDCDYIINTDKLSPNDVFIEFKKILKSAHL